MFPHFNRKIFVKASQISAASDLKRKSEVQKNAQLKGDEAEKFYQSVLNEPSTSTSQGASKRIKINIVKTDTSDSKTIPNDVKISDIFKATENDQIDFVEKALKLKPEFLNCLDSYGWTLLMVASKANSVHVVKLLMSLNADTSVQDKAGHNCFNLAANQTVKSLLRPKITELEVKLNKNPIADDDSNAKKDQNCEICQIEGLTKKQFNNHLTSTVHQMKVHGIDSNPKVHYVIPEANRGFQMMLNSGWQSNKGLGPQGKESGKLYPVRTELKRDRHGLDFKKNDKKVTHFQAFDVNSVKKPKNDDDGNDTNDRTERQTTLSKRRQTKQEQKSKNREIDFRREFL